MCAAVDLQGEIDRCLKVIQESVDEFDQIWKKVHDTENGSQKEKLEADLEKEIWNLQRLSDQIRSWIFCKDISDKSALRKAKQAIQREMDRFEVREKEAKLRWYARPCMGLLVATWDLLEPREQAKMESREWIDDMIDKLNIQIEQFEYQVEELQAGLEEKATLPQKLVQLEEVIAVHKKHAAALEKALRCLDNDVITSEEIDPLKEDLEYYLCQPSEEQYDNTDDMYCEIADRLEAVEAAAPAAAALGTTATHVEDHGKGEKFKGSGDDKVDEDLAKNKECERQQAAAAAVRAWLFAESNSNVELPGNDDHQPNPSRPTFSPPALSPAESESIPPPMAAAAADTYHGLPLHDTAAAVDVGVAVPSLPTHAVPCQPTPRSYVDLPATPELQDLCLEALKVTLQHPAVAADQRNICTLLQVSKACRAAVQQSAAGLTDVRFQSSYDSVMKSRGILRSIVTFAEWLASYPQLLNSLDVCGRQLPEHSNPVRAAISRQRGVQELLEHCLQIAAAKADAQFCLAAYSSALPPTARLLAVLPAAALTKLELHQVDNSNWFMAIGQLTELRQLRLNMDAFVADSEATNGPLCEIGKLDQLTELELWRVSSDCDLLLLPAQLQQLTLLFRQDRSKIANPGGAVASLQHLASLRHLRLGADKLAVGSSVPPNLRSLEIQACWPAGAVAGLRSLKQVTSVALNGLTSAGCYGYSVSISSDDLRSLERLPRLECLSLALSIDWDLDPLLAAVSWQDLPLCSLNAYVVNDYEDSSEIPQLMQDIGTATKLTSLEVYIPKYFPNHFDGPGPALCEHLKTLKNLKRLDLCIYDPDLFSEQNAHYLTMLTTLTSLDLCTDWSRPGWDAALFQSLLDLELTNLVQLSVTVGDKKNGEHLNSV